MTKLYDRRGYKETARRPMIKEQWRNGGKDWVLMIKSIELA